MTGRHRGHLSPVGAHDLGDNLREYDQQTGSHRGGDGKHLVVVTEGSDCNGGDHGGERGIDQVVAQQNGGQQLVGLAEQPEDLSRPPAPLSGQVAHAVTVDGHQAGLGHREKSRHQEQQQQSQALGPKG